VDDDLLVEVLFDVAEVVALDVVFLYGAEIEEELVVVEEVLVLDEVELEELLVPPPAHLDKSAVFLNASEITLVELELPLVTSNLVVDA